MKVHPATGALILTFLALTIAFISCGPKCVVRGRIVDAETQQPIEGAAVAIRWFTDNSEKQSGRTEEILDAVQVLSDVQGVFQLPEYADKKYILGVYKSGYICWSSQDIFLIEPGEFIADEYLKRKKQKIKNGMLIELEPLKKLHPKDLHAGFTVMVAGESTDTYDGPFHQAIKSEYRCWRESLRKDFQEQLGEKRLSDPGNPTK